MAFKMNGHALPGFKQRNPKKNTVNRLLEELPKHEGRVNKDMYFDDEEAQEMFRHGVENYPKDASSSNSNQDYWQNVDTDSSGTEYMYQDDGDEGIVKHKDGKTLLYPVEEVVERKGDANAKVTKRS